MGIKEAGLSCVPTATSAPPPTRAVTTTTMVASAAFRGLLFAGLLAVVCRGQVSQEATLEDFGGEKAEPSADRDLVSTPARTRMMEQDNHSVAHISRTITFLNKLSIDSILGKSSYLHFRFFFFNTLTSFKAMILISRYFKNSLW